MKTAKQAEKLVGKKFFVDGYNVNCVEFQKTVEAKNKNSNKVQTSKNGLNTQFTNKPSQNQASVRDELQAHRKNPIAFSQQNS